MRASLAQLSQIHLTLFTRANCGLCNTAKSRLIEFKNKATTPVNYSEVDIMAPDQQQWRDVYDFDVPVLHIDNIVDGTEQFQPSLDAVKKLMHRFTVEELAKAVNEVRERSS
jgi:hypothetical protein